MCSPTAKDIAAYNNFLHEFEFRHASIWSQRSLEFCPTFEYEGDRDSLS